MLPQWRARGSVAVFTVHATRTLLRRIGRIDGPDNAPGRRSTGALGDWYATALTWRPQAALFVNETTLLPVLLPLAPAATVTSRFPAALAQTLAAHQVPRLFRDTELAHMTECRMAPTSNRSVVGIMVEFSRLAQAYRTTTETPDLLALALWLARTPCGPLYHRHVSPDRELAALVAEHTP
jgi:hypothetical protein